MSRMHESYLKQNKKKQKKSRCIMDILFRCKKDHNHTMGKICLESFTSRTTMEHILRYERLNNFWTANRSWQFAFLNSELLLGQRYFRQYLLLYISYSLSTSCNLLTIAIMTSPLCFLFLTPENYSFNLFLKIYLFGWKCVILHITSQGSSTTYVCPKCHLHLLHYRIVYKISLNDFFMTINITKLF